MGEKEKINGTDDAWDSRALGADANFVQVAEDADEESIDRALELQPISIRLQKSLIEDFKLIGRMAGIGYQPLMRQALMRFADCEKKRILREVASDAAKRKENESATEQSATEQARTGTNG